MQTRTNQIKHNACSHLAGKFVTLVALGDSITAVTHWTHGGLNWVDLLRMGLGSRQFPKGFTIINSGIGGDSIAGGLARLERDVLRFNPDIVFISYGPNDVLNATPASFKKDLHEAIRRLRNHGPCKIILRTPVPAVDMNCGQELTEMKRGNKLVPFKMSGYARVIVEVARIEKTYLVDHYKLWTQSMKSRYAGEMVLLMGNSIHPNANGHRRLYAEIAPLFGAEVKFQHEWEHLLMMQARGE